MKSFSRRPNQTLCCRGADIGCHVSTLTGFLVGQPIQKMLSINLASQAGSKGIESKNHLGIYEADFCVRKLGSWTKLSKSKKCAFKSCQCKQFKDQSSLHLQKSPPASPRHIGADRSTRAQASPTWKNPASSCVAKLQLWSDAARSNQSTLMSA